MSQKSATVAENGETTAIVAEFCDSRTFLRQCGQALTIPINTECTTRRSVPFEHMLELQRMPCDWCPYCGQKTSYSCTQQNSEHSPFKISYTVC